MVLELEPYILEHQKTHGLRVAMMDGKTMKIGEEVVRLPLIWGGRLLHTTFVVQPSSCADIILGAKFLQRCEIKMRENVVIKPVSNGYLTLPLIPIKGSEIMENVDDVLIPALTQLAVRFTRPRSAKLGASALVSPIGDNHIESVQIAHTVADMGQPVALVLNTSRLPIRIPSGSLNCSFEEISEGQLNEISLAGDSVETTHGKDARLPERLDIEHVKLLPKQQKRAVFALIREFDDIFSTTPGRIVGVSHEIITEGPPLAQKPRRESPRQDDLLESLEGMRFFSTIDLTAGYWQVPMDENSIQKTAFTCSLGLFENLVMPFGLCNAPATFQRAMDLILATLKFDAMLPFDAMLGGFRTQRKWKFSI